MGRKMFGLIMIGGGVVLFAISETIGGIFGSGWFETSGLAIPAIVILIGVLIIFLQKKGGPNGH